jgi:sugar phosphate isomerase/epimerase
LAVLCSYTITHKEASMRFGICASADQISLVKSAGYAYVELGLSATAALSDDDFAALAGQVKAAGLSVEAFNNFFPRQIRLTGPVADLEAAWAYARSAFARAQKLGGQVVVFGSGGARNVPDGFPMDLAWAQLVTLLRGLDPIAREHGITIAIEHLNRSECNVVLSVADGLRLAEDAGCANIQVLADSYHMLKESEDAAILPRLGARLVHAHTARSTARLYPTEADDQLRSFFAGLRQAGYTGRVSVEGKTEAMQADAVQSLAVLRGLST